MPFLTKASPSSKCFPMLQYTSGYQVFNIPVLALTTPFNLYQSLAPAVHSQLTSAWIPGSAHFCPSLSDAR